MINKKIATYILRAQNASDGGKSIDVLVSNKRSYRDNCCGYQQKDTMIITAINMIRSNKSSFKFAVIRDRGLIAKYIVYFETRINNVKFQVSFHSFDERLEKYVRNSFRIKWDHGCSRDSAVTIYRHYNNNGAYSANYVM